MEALAKKFRCQLCHTVDVRGVGPAYRDVAKKYAKNKEAEAKSLVKLKKGAQGTRGKVPMRPVDDVSKVDPKAMTQWILAGPNWLAIPPAA